MSAVRVEKNGPVTTVILSRPDVRNAVDRPTAALLAEAFLAFERDEEALVAVFAGDHGSFCAGADLKAVAQGPEGARRGNLTVPPATGLDFDRLAADGPMGPSRMVLSKPVIGAIAGYAVAGGLELALCCDVIVTSTKARFGLPEGLLGLSPGGGGTQRRSDDR